MDYGRLLNRAWEIIWNNKFLILLGVLASLGSGGGGGGGGGGSSSPSGPGIRTTPVPGQEWPSTTPGIPQIPTIPEWVLGLGIGLLVVIVVIALVVGLALWVISRIATGGLIAGVDQIEREGTSSFSRAWGAGWQKGWQMIFIGLIPSLPILFGIAVTAVAVISMAGGFSAIADDPNAMARDMASNMSIVMVMAAILCPTFLLSLALGIVAYFAERACMLENMSFSESFRRGWEVLKTNFGSAFLLWLIQIGLSLGIGVILCLPSVLMAFCCLLWPVLWLINGTLHAYFSTLWTLAWRQWAGGEPAGSFTVEKSLGV